LPVFLVYAMRRVSCPTCKRVVIEQIPWATGKSPMTLAFLVFLASWAKVVAWKEVGIRFRVGWDAVYRAVEWVVEYGKEHRNLEGVTAVGVDEIQRSHGRHYLTMVYQIDAGCRRLLWIGRGRTKKAFQAVLHLVWKRSLRQDPILLHRHVETLSRSHRQACTRCPRPCSTVSISSPNLAWQSITSGAKKPPGLRAKGKQILVRTRWIWLKPVNLTRKQRHHRRDLFANPVNLDLKTIKAYFFRLDLDRLYGTTPFPEHAGHPSDDWCQRVMRSRIQPMMTVARTFRSHRDLILNYFRARKVFSSGVVEGLNNKAKVGMRRAIRKSYAMTCLKSRYFTSLERYRNRR
jgi:hypothetical protein